ncbi:MAG: DUF4398 domain-containing protein [Proteobacteria bacterium]|nr:DUF4398 domain-containing protein [Pseudomonadota bacterium]
MNFYQKRMFGSLLVTLGVAALVILSACAKPPIKEIATAEAALEKARTAEAPTYAPETFKSAEEMLAQAKTEMQNKKYIPLTMPILPSIHPFRDIRPDQSLHRRQNHMGLP